MRKVLMVSAVALAFLGTFNGLTTVFAGETIAREAGPAMGYYFCLALEDPTPTASKGKAYYSAVFIADANNLAPIREAYVKFLQEKYGYAQDPSTLNSSVQFTGTQTMEQATYVEQMRVKKGKDLNPEGTIETSWAFGA